MGDTKQWGKNDVAAMLRLVAGLHEPRSTVTTRRRTLLEGICALVGAIGGVLWVGIDPSLPAPTDVSAVAVGFSPEVSERLLGGSLDGDPHDPALRKLIRRSRPRGAGSTLTHTRRQLVDDRRWYASAHVAQIRKLAGIDDSIYSVHVLAPGRAAALCVAKPYGDRRLFSDAARQLVDLLHHECAWLYRDQTSDSEVDGLPLSPRARQTLRKLLAGRGEKQIAGEMRLSINTVHHYVKAIYRHFGVSSRAELLARWMDREG
jgi:DNA-binding CsgD family transcriptional regulator